MTATARASEFLGAAQGALDAGNFDEAIERLQASLELHDDAAEAHDLYAVLLFADDRILECRTHWETAFRLYRQEREDRKAIRVAANLAFMHFDAGNEAASRGWISRAQRLADGVGRCVERGYLALALAACDVRDVTALESAAEVALELAVEFADPNLEARALADLGLALISQGRLADGFAHLDEAMAPLSAGEVTDLAMAGLIFCNMLSACERTGDIRRAEEWLRACTEYASTRMFGKFPVLHTHCRIAYGRVLCDAGRLTEAETELEEARGPSATGLQTKQASGAAVFAELRLLQGRVEDAAEILAPFADRFEVCTALAKLHIVRDEPDLAVATILRGLQEMVGDRLRGGPLLGLLVEVEVSRGNLEAARRYARRLAAYADEAQGPLLRAEAELAEGRCAMAESDTASAVRALDAGRRAAGEGQRPALSARITLELARAKAASGDTAEAIDHGRAALVAFERLGAKRDADRTASLLRELGAPGRSRPRVADAGLTAREREVLALLAEGLSNAEIAKRLYITSKTAEHHVGRILGKLEVRSRTEAAAVAARASQG